ncbi:hypothetical protein Ae706Ps2_2834 [Pseudonocardia sp. Ae706_Ps2]|nr:hypothetical protein Ae331Ps2_3103c [Pseudonocardia sp. Ae331_Ps2]OLM12343.1 hypothetical protein Ae505Ps2_2471c [Pseudonocardia sp. Ae505_Ps2]OLM24401.1 hypothetical protein Ae706Ps2_2834 [Pseudonocardia sp. Ae706_Ps2]
MTHGHRRTAATTRTAEHHTRPGRAPTTGTEGDVVRLPWTGPGHR